MNPAIGMRHIRKLRVIGGGCALLIFSSSVWLYGHAGLALVVDSVTGEKGCVNRLAVYVGLDEADWRFAVVQGYSLLWLPMVLLASIVLLSGVVRWLRNGKPK